MMQWAWHRDRWNNAKAAVEESNRVEGLAKLDAHPTVAFALAQIDAAERAIESVANEMLIECYDEEDY